MRKNFFITIAVTAAFAGGFALGCHHRRGHQRCVTVTNVVSDTVVTRDTVLIDRPVYVASRPSTRYVTVHDTIVVPAQTRVYADSNYRAVVSGIDPRLDSITLYPRRITVNHRTPARWGLGVTAGVTVTPRGLQPSVGVGVVYMFKSF